MKKKYVLPELAADEAQASQMMAVSILDGDADPQKPVLTKEDNGWEIWGDDAE